MAPNIVNNQFKFCCKIERMELKIDTQRATSEFTVYWNEVKQFRWFKDAEISE